MIASGLLRAHYPRQVNEVCLFKRSSKRSLPAVAGVLYLLLLVSLATVAGCTQPPKAHFDTIAIEGTPRFESQVEHALALLRSNSPAAYALATDHVAVIEQSAHSGMLAWLPSPKFQLNDRSAFYSVTWCAGVIAHDSFHSKLYHDYLKEHSLEGSVPDHVWKGEQAERLCLDHQKVVMLDIGAPPLEVRQLDLTNRYWEVDYRKRNW